MLKRVTLFTVVLSLLCLFSVNSFAARVLQTIALTDQDVKIIRKCSNEGGTLAVENGQIELNGKSGAAALARSLNVSTNGGVVFTVTYGEDYTGVTSDTFDNYHFGVGLMDASCFMGAETDTGRGIGVDFTFTENAGGYRLKTYSYNGADSKQVNHLGKNKTYGDGIQATKSFQLKFERISATSWKLWNLDDGILIADFNPADFGDGLFADNKAYFVIGCFGASPINMSVTVNQVYGFTWNEPDPVEEPNPPVTPVAQKNVAYALGEHFVWFLDPDGADANNVKLDATGKWASVTVDGALGGTALYCRATGGEGVTIRFAVPVEGDYSIWARVLYPNQLSNSLFYTVDGGTQNIWDFPDEDDEACNCYNSWQYVYMSTRVSGTYEDPELYGTFTMEYNEWRHAPNRLHLTAGVHELNISGREAGIYLDELIVTSYDVNAYDPNVCEGNNAVLEVCKFCGTNVHHYVKDVYAVTGVPAATYFAETLHEDAVVWECREDLGFPEPEQPNPPSSGEQTGTQEPPKPEQPKDPETTADVTQEEPTSGTQPSAPEKGCSSSLAVSALGVILMVGMACAVTKKRR